ncbi:MFS transporter [Dictyobacter alpinus]|uniref:MFS transporter n=1 Tax=Dictyobacter alpinus TaxID=2014873 RepID=A0A402BK69_9CHLR|nr:MFS transporter [Dictyobacter alpinus]GCE31748.1 MFS transporter [Dictyobacter alpinus]
MSHVKLDSRAPFGALWRHADFLKVWAGETVSMVGSQVTTIALPLTAVLLFKATSIELGFLYAAGFAPFLFLTLLAGVWIDHQRRRPILLVTNIGQAILLSLIPLLALIGWLRMEYLYLIAVLVGCLAVFTSLAFQAFLPALIPRDDLLEGNSKLSVSQSIAEISSPGLAGWLVQYISAPLTIAVDAFSFLVAAISLALIRTPEPKPTSATNLHSIPHEISEGFHTTFTNRYLRAFAGEAATYNLFWQVILTIFFLYAIRELHYNSGSIGLLFAVGSVGALCGALLTGRIARRIGVGLTIVATAALSDAPMLVLPFMTGSTSNSLIILVCAFFLQGIGITGCNVHVNSIRQVIIPDHLRGRANASYRLLVSGALPLGSLLGGFLGAWIGLQFTLLVGAMGLLSTWLWILFSPIPRLHKLDTLMT